ncbi:MAG: BNR repeat-containing protein [Chitinophagaceae bacterium]
MKYLFVFAGCLTAMFSSNAQQLTRFPVETAWASNSVNVTVFRKNSVVSWKNNQYTAYYDQQGYIKIAKRKICKKDWQITQTNLHGDVKDAHKIISIMVDGDGYIHLCWNEHNDVLHYAKSTRPNTVRFDKEIPMTGTNENKVTYPEFYRMANGNLLFLYRDGGSGNGNMVINRYDLKTKKWSNVHHNLIDGEGKRNAYWQACTDNAGNIYVSWVWRESPDVASNHDMCFAMSSDGGATWTKSNGEAYQLPITAASAEYVCHIPQNSNLINQCSMAAITDGNTKNVVVASYWNDSLTQIPQYQVLCLQDGKWSVSSPDHRTEGFSLGGYGTKSIPISRPQIVTAKRKGKLFAALVFRDNDRGNKVSVAVSDDLHYTNWTIKDLDTLSVGAWEPTFDTELWKTRQVLDLFVQPVTQVDGEGLANKQPTMVEVWEVRW